MPTKKRRLQVWPLLSFFPFHLQTVVNSQKISCSVRCDHSTKRSQHRSPCSWQIHANSDTHKQKQTLKESSEQRERHSLHNVNILMNSLTLSTLRIAIFMENLPPTLDRGMMCPSWPALLIGTLHCCTFRFSTILRNIGKWNETSGSTSMYVYIYIQSQSCIKKVYSTVSYIPTQPFHLNSQNRGAKVGNSRAMVVPTRARLESCLKWVAVKTCD